jgi:hypothetical protein
MVDRRVGLLALMVGLLVACPAWAQIANNGNNGVNNANNTNNGGNAFGAAGVVIDANGVLSMKFAADPRGALTRQRIEQAKIKLNKDVAKPSELRKISLQRLEKAIADLVAKGDKPTEDMEALAGLTRVQYVFFYPETKDIVLAGPAEGYMADAGGRLVGINTGAAIVMLEDLVAALRAYPPSGGGVHQIRCSIDPTKEGLQKMQEFVIAVHKSNPRPSDAGLIAGGLKEKLGLQDVSINGVSPKSHFAQVLVEADYRMKLIGIGLETPPVKISSYISKANPRDVARNGLQRWYFTPDYECIKVAGDDLAMEMVGQGVKLIGEDELVNADGSRAVNGAHNNGASKAFTESFTKLYPELAKKSPVYAQLKNVIDLAIAAAFMQEKDYYGRAGWKMEVLGDERAVPVETCDVPKHVESTVNVVWRGNMLMTPIGGGVSILPRQALESGNLQKDDGKVAATKEKIDLSKLGAGQWWWD